VNSKDETLMTFVLISSKNSASGVRGKARTLVNRKGAGSAAIQSSYLSGPQVERNNNSRLPLLSLSISFFCVQLDALLAGAFGAVNNLYDMKKRGFR
jgi:hypothetical protein